MEVAFIIVSVKIKIYEEIQIFSSHFVDNYIYANIFWDCRGRCSFVILRPIKLILKWVIPRVF